MSSTSLSTPCARAPGRVSHPLGPFTAVPKARAGPRAGLAWSALGRRRRRASAGPQSTAARPQAPPAATAANGSAGGDVGSGGPLLLWYKRDLRLDDHPGWHAAAASGGGVQPVFVFDPARYAALVLPSGGAEALCSALASLDRSLRQRGSRLLVRVGRWEEELPALAGLLGGGGVVAEAEVEADWREGVERVAAALAPGAALHEWRAPLLADGGDDFGELEARGLRCNELLPPLEQLPPLPSSSQPPNADDAAGSGGLGVDAAQLRSLAAQAFYATLSPRLRQTAAALPGYGGGSSSEATASFSFSEEEEERGSRRLLDRLVPGSDGEDGMAGRAAATSPPGCSGIGREAWEAAVAAEIAAGEGPVLRALSSYLRHLEESGGGSETEEEEAAAAAALAEAIRRHDLPATPDGCFPALFGRALLLGVVSKRRVHSEAAALLAQQAEQEWPLGFAPLRQLAWLLTSGGGAAARLRRRRKAAAAAAAAVARDFHEGMAAGREGSAVHGATRRHWRWRGLLTDYLHAPAAGGGSADRPAILLCHGFGAFSEHYRDNVAALAAAGYDVYAPTLPGYGRAEKPALPYSQDLWSQFLADFVLQVVRRPAVAAGNSIGGFISASLAADYPGAVEGLVLLNSAGRIVPGYQPPAVAPKARPPPRYIVEGVARALFAFLEGDVTNQLRRVYPVRPDRADAWLGGEIARAARDPGALGVFRSVFYLPPPRALNHLVVDRFGGPTLVLQGEKDPLNDARRRATELAAACPNARVVRLDAGHCPHDEVPEQVNQHILEFIERQVLPAAAARAPQPAAAK